MSDGTLYTALLAAQRAMGPVKKDASNPAFRTRYASLQSVLETIEEPLWANGLVLVQRFTQDGEGPILATELIHAASGEKLTSAVRVACKDPLDPQKVGGAITYYRRYAILALLGLAPEDDDGNSAARPAPAPQRPQPRAQQEQSPDNGGGRASERQVKFIYAIAREAGLDEQELDAWSQELYGDSVDRLNRRDASMLIEALQRRRNEVA
jgi:hypothetical protein